ncbi:MAG: beta-galactosidase [Planctomycetes bacterium]|nr:beta-galactosidase [Planctomycetota bacterium]
MSDLPRPEHPRPDRFRDRWINLNGPWDFEFDAGLSGEARGLSTGDKPFDTSIIVPFAPESPLSGIGDTDFHPACWYRRSFELPDDWNDGRILLHFGAVDYAARVWVNGIEVGGIVTLKEKKEGGGSSINSPRPAHCGGYTPFSVDITRCAVPGTNTVVVEARDNTRNPLQPSGKQSQRYHSHGCSYTRSTGIWQTVYVELAGRSYISDFRVMAEPRSGAVVVVPRIMHNAGGLSLKVSINRLGKTVTASTVPIEGFSNAAVLSVPEPEPWEPANPALYDVRLELASGGAVIDAVNGYFGFRTAGAAGPALTLNGKPLFQRLVLDQGYYPDGIYTAPSDEALKKDIEISMAMGFNGARLHQKVFEPRFLYWCDRLGYIVWDEYPSWGLDLTDRRAMLSLLPEWLEVVTRDVNHPAVVGWCPLNETTPAQDPEILRSIHRLTKMLDPTRPCIDTSGYVHVETDVYDSHDYTQDAGVLSEHFAEFAAGGEPWHNREQDVPYDGQPYIVSEYGGAWWAPGREDGWGYGETPKSPEEVVQRYRELTTTLLRHPRMAGFCYTQLYDIEQEQNGLYDYERNPKFDPGAIARINSRKAAVEE